MIETKWTRGQWSTEAISDAVRVVLRLGGQKKIILARLAPPQLSESETHANAHLMAAAPELYEAVELLLTVSISHDHIDKARAVLAKARGEQS